MIRPRLYEADPARMTAPIGDLLKAVNVNFVPGRVVAVRALDGEVDVDQGAETITQGYDRLVVATGSRLCRPSLKGAALHGFSVDQHDDALALEAHLLRLASQPRTQARDTVVVIGAGFTGLELAAELPGRLRAILGSRSTPRVVLVERETVVGPDLGPGPRGVIEEALQALGVELRLGAEVVAVDAVGIDLRDGERLETQTIIWTAGVKASLPTHDFASPRDPAGRLRVDRYLRLSETPAVFAAGDVAWAATDDGAPCAMMSCQHAMALGRAAGHNAAADLLGQALVAYRQPRYVTCLDLGPWGAVFTETWDRTVRLSGPAAKAIKRHINTERIYPPSDRASAFAAADPNLDHG